MGDEQQKGSTDSVESSAVETSDAAESVVEATEVTAGGEAAEVAEASVPEASGAGTSGAGAEASATKVADVTADATEKAATSPDEVLAAEIEDLVEAEAEAEEAAYDDGAGPLGAELELLRAQLDEAQVDIKRVAAEYKNYRERVKRDQAVVAERATAETLVALLPVLDDLDRAREHGDLTGPFGSVAEQLTSIVTKLGLTAFGAKGDPFDPNRHEAVAHLPSADVTEPTCIEVLRRGYLLGERLLRPAMVAVAAPE